LPAPEAGAEMSRHRAIQVASGNRGDVPTGR
jgi:hypothetical protein